MQLSRAAAKRAVSLCAEFALKRGGFDAYLRLIKPQLPVILSLHRVIPAADSPFVGEWVTTAKLDLLLSFLRRAGFAFVTMDVLHDRMREGQSTRGLVVITSDDGFRDNLEHLLPMLKRHRAPAIIYVCASMVEAGEVPWPYRLRRAFEATQQPVLDFSGRRYPLGTVSERLAASVEVVRDVKKAPLDPVTGWAVVLAALAPDGGPERREGLDLADIDEMSQSGWVTFGCHGNRHLPLTRCTAHELAGEVVDAKARLESLLDRPIHHFAYPNYEFDRDAVELLERTGYRTAVTNFAQCQQQSRLAADHPRLTIPRVNIGGDGGIGLMLLSILRATQAMP